MTYPFREEFRALLDKHRMYSIEQLDQSLVEGHSQLWTGHDSALVTSICQYGSGAKIGQADWAVGNLDEILSCLMPLAEGFLKSRGCERIMFEGRMGWARVLKQHGYEAHSVTLVKELA